MLTASAAGGQAGDGAHDSRTENITVQHLLDHKGGWCRDFNHTGDVKDFMFSSVKIATVLGVTSPPSQQDIVRYVMDQDLDYTPGSVIQGCQNYSNFGYMVLGLIVEEYSNMSYVDYVNQNIFQPIGIANTEFIIGDIRPGSFRNPREPNYLTSMPLLKNIYDPTGPLVEDANGGFDLAALDAAGGVVTTAHALLTFSENYELDSGDPRTSNSGFVNFGGSLDGTISHSEQGLTSENIDYVVILNKRMPDSHILDNLIGSRLSSALEKILFKDVAKTGLESRDSPHQGAYTLDIPINTGQAVIKTTGADGDVALYVKYGSEPTTTSYDCKSDKNNSSIETCTIGTPAQGFHYIMINNQSVAYNDLSISATYTAISGDNSCNGNCGGQAAGGCYCDSACTSYGDCCSDYDAVCNGDGDGDGDCCADYQSVCV